MGQATIARWRLGIEMTGDVGMSSADGVPTEVGGYAVIGRVGSGATGTVFKARDAGLGRDVALKRVPAASVAGLRAEAARLAQLDDPHVVSVYGFVQEPDAAYLVLEWIEGATLAEVLAAGGRLSVAQALGVCRGALSGLAHAHARGIVHGDVSASNVLVDTAGDSRLIDFGVGGSTPAYRAPEVGAGAPLSPAVDVYAAAAVLVHLLTGRATPDNSPDLGHVDSGIRPVLATALSPAPGDRFPDAAAFLAALEEAAERTYGAAWWTTAGVPALVAPAIAVMVPLGGGVAGVGGVIGTTIAGGAGGAGRKALPWKVVVGAGAAALVIIAGAVTAIAVTGDDGDDAAERGSSSDDDEPSDAASDPTIDPVVDTVPSGEYTYRQVATASNDPSWVKVGESTDRIWTITADCASADDCGGSITSSSGSTFTFTWDGSTLSQALDNAVATEEGDCTDDTGQVVGRVTLEAEQTPVPLTYTPTGAIDAETGLAEAYTSGYRFTQTIIDYVDFQGGPSRPRDCPFTGINKIQRAARYEVTLTRGADPGVAAAEEKRIAKEEAAQEPSEEPTTR